MIKTKANVGEVSVGAGTSRIYDFDVLKKSFRIQDVPNNEYKIDENMMPEVLNQGTFNSCAACVLAVILEYFDKLENGDYRPLSHPYIYGKHRPANSTNVGMHMETALSSMLNCGTVPMAVFGKAMEMPDIKKAVQGRDDLEEIAIPSKIGGFCKIRWNNDANMIKNIKLAIANTNTPIVAVSNYAFGEPHCIIIYGVNEAEKKVFVQNSWGESWGNKGRAMISIDDIDHMWLIMDEKVALPFKDVPESAWYYKAVLHMYSAGYINGKSENEFCPDDNIKRSEVAVIFDRILKNIDEVNDASYRSLEERLSKIEQKVGIR